MRISHLLAAALVLGMVPGRAAANEPGPAPGADESKVDCQHDCGPGEPGTGGAGSSMGAAGAPSEEATTPPPSSSESSVTVVNVGEEKKEKERSPNQGLAVAAQGGIEGYTSSLAPRINPGGAYGLMVTAQPVPIVGLELGYSGATNAISDPTIPGGSRVVRNGGSVDVKVSLLPRAVEPFLFGGVGINRATIRNNTEGSGYQNDTFGSVPVGGGINYHAGHFLIGARGTYDWLFARDFTPPTPGNKLGIDSAQMGDIWRADLQVGGTF